MEWTETKILAFRKNKISVEAADVEDIGAVGAWATTTTQAAVSGLAWENGATLYYPIQNAYDFYGYYIDDAMNGRSGYHTGYGRCRRYPGICLHSGSN